jgi:hypothetical protein
MVYNTQDYWVLWTFPSSGAWKSPKKPVIHSLLVASCKLSFLPASDGFLLVILFDLEDGDDMFFRNVGLSPNYTVFQSRNPCFS